MGYKYVHVILENLSTAHMYRLGEKTKYVSVLVYVTPSRRSMFHISSMEPPSV